VINSPKVIFNCEYVPSLNNTNNRYKTNNQIQRTANGMFNYYSDVKKRAMYMFDYYKGYLTKEDEMNLVIENGKYATREDIKLRQKQYQKYIENSNLYKCVISFNNDYLTTHADIRKMEQDLVKDIIPMFLKKCGFKDIRNMSYQIALHTDTDNLHFHFSFIEKKPNYKTNNGIEYRKQGKLTEEERNFLKNEIVHYLEKEKYFKPLLIETNKEMENLKKFFNKDEKNFILKDKDELLIEDKILKLGELLYYERNGKDSKIKYNSIRNKEITKLATEIKRYLFSNKNKDFKNEYDSFKDSLKRLDYYFDKIKYDNHGKKSDNSLIINKEKYFDNYVMNAIVNHAVYLYRNNSKRNINENTIVEAIVLDNYVKNKKQTRLNILHNYLLNKTPANRFKNRYQIEQAIKHINDEMDEASKEFSKLFASNDKEYS
jgi:hypothetical protein